MIIALFLTLCLEFLEDQYWTIYFLTFTFVIFSDTGECDIAGYADNNTSYTSSFNSDAVIKKFELNTKLIQ